MSQILLHGLFAVLLAAGIAVAIEVELFEAVFALTRQYEAWELDEVFSAMLIVAIVLPFYLLNGNLRLRRAATALRAAEDAARIASRVDPLTGIPNRRQFHTSVAEAVAAGRAVPTTLLIDLDGFKPINDLRGHAVGDQVLVRMARRMVRACRPEDLVVRIGGDEFAVLLADGTGLEAARALAERIRESLSHPIDIEGAQLTLSASIGIAQSHMLRTATEALGYADAAMYKAKRRGGGAIVVFEERMHAELSRRATIERRLRESIDTDAITPVFQPIVRLEDLKIVGIEVLSRWPDGNADITTQDFITAAEANGSIRALGDQVLAKACRTLTGCPEAVWMSFNLSAKQFADPDLPDRVLAILAEHGIAPERLQVEITETAIVSDLQLAYTLIDRFQEAGVRVALDDFGAGASSLTLLATLPVDRIKIDRSFVGGVDGNPAEAKIVTSLMVLARSLNLDVVAEGVERTEEHDFLRELGCPKAQGYLYARPAPAAAIQAMLKNQNRASLQASAG